MNIPELANQLNEIERLKHQIVNAYKTAYFDAIAMFVIDDLDTERVKEEMEEGLKDHLDFVHERLEP